MQFTDEELEIPINQVDDHLYIGGVDARREEILNEHQIKRIIWLTTEVEQYEAASFLPEGVRETIIHLSDNPNSNINAALRQAIPLIEKSIEAKENVLVHCWMGVSRSASIIIGFLIRNRKMTAKQALDYLEMRRPCVWPNHGFWNQLLIFEQEERTTL